MSQEVVPPPSDSPGPVADGDQAQNATAWLLTITAEAEVIPGEPKESEE